MESTQPPGLFESRVKIFDLPFAEATECYSWSRSYPFQITNKKPFKISQFTKKIISGTSHNCRRWQVDRQWSEVLAPMDVLFGVGSVPQSFMILMKERVDGEEPTKWSLWKNIWLLLLQLVPRKVLCLPLFILHHFLYINYNIYLRSWPGYIKIQKKLFHWWWLDLWGAAGKAGRTEAVPRSGWSLRV